MCGDDVYEKLVDVVIPLLETVDGSPSIIFPPQPRYVFNGCCNDSSHCTNMKNEGYSEKILSATLHLRTILKNKLEKKLSGPFRVLDTCSMVADPADKSLSVKLNELPAMMAKDGVHMSNEGYVHMANNIVQAIVRIQAGDHAQSGTAAVSLVTGAGRYHWRRFTSPVGSKLAGGQHGWNK